MTSLDGEEHHVVREWINQPSDPLRRQLITTYPRQPLWWEDEESAERRHEVYRDFDPADVSMLVDEVAAYMVSPPTTSHKVAALVRRQWALSWLAEVASGALKFDPPSESLEVMVRYWQARAARYLADAAWRLVMDLPASMVAPGVEAAMVNRSEIEDVDDD